MSYSIALICFFLPLVLRPLFAPIYANQVASLLSINRRHATRSYKIHGVRNLGRKVTLRGAAEIVVVLVFDRVVGDVFRPLATLVGHGGNRHIAEADGGRIAVRGSAVGGLDHLR